MVCIRSASVILAVVLVTSSITAFSVLPQFNSRPSFVVGDRSATSLFMSATTSAEFELPDDVPERRRDSTSSQMSSSQDTLSETRRQRLQVEDEAKGRFVTGDELQELRKNVLKMRQDLEQARRTSATKRAQKLELAIIGAQQVDAEFVYSVALERFAVAKDAGLVEEADQWEEEAALARSALPQFNLEGLWVGKYGENGYEMINVTYVGDTLIAHKITGDKNVPKGEVTFSADLSASAKEQLEPIELGEGAAKQWGSTLLQRFAGQGQVAAEGFENSQWMEGHLILVGEYFSFAWIPIGHQVFFGRPSADLTLKLLRDNKAESRDDKLRSYLTRCLEETESLEDEMEVHDSPFFTHDQQDYYSQDGCFE